jgi:Invasion protein B, involved in pathogenesis
MALAALAAIAGPAWAQATPAPSGVTNWPTSCGSATRSAPVICTATAAAFIRETGQKMLEARLRTSPGQPARLFVVGPFGIAVRQPFILSLDGTELARAQVYTCEQDGCYADVEMTEDLVGQLSAATTLTVTFTRLNGEQVAVPLPLDGFAQAYAAIR